MWQRLGVYFKRVWWFLWRTWNKKIFINVNTRQQKDVVEKKNRIVQQMASAKAIDVIIKDYARL